MDAWGILVTLWLLLLQASLLLALASIVLTAILWLCMLVYFVVTGKLRGMVPW